MSAPSGVTDLLRSKSSLHLVAGVASHADGGGYWLVSHFYADSCAQTVRNKPHWLFTTTAGTNIDQFDGIVLSVLGS